MIKKITVVFAVLTAVCVLAIIPLTPFAVRDLANTIIPRYQQLKAVQPVEVFPLDDSITTLSLDSAAEVHITRSENREIIVKSSQLSQGDLSVESSVQGDTANMTLSIKYGSLNFLSLLDSPSDLWDYLIRMFVNSAEIELSIPDGLILVNRDGRNLLDSGGQGGSHYNTYTIDRDVTYFRVEDVIQPDSGDGSQKPVSSFESRVRLLRSDLLQLVRSNAEGQYTQLEFNMELNDCRIRLEALLLEYAKDQGLIDYDKEQSSAKRTGLSGRLGAVDSSVNEQEAKSVIRELSGLYLSRLVVQAQLDHYNESTYTYRYEAGPDDLDETEAKEFLERQIEEYTSQIKALEDTYTEFVTGLMATGLLF